MAGEDWLRERREQIEAELRRSRRGLKWSLIGLACGCGLIVLGNAIHLLVTSGVIH